jgi:hypothetical protein
VSIATARPLIPALYRVRFRVQFDAPPGAAMTCHAGGLATTRPSGSHVQAAAVGYRRVNAGNAPLTLACRLGNAFATARVEHASLELTRVRSAASVQRGSAERCFGYPPRCVAAKHK